MSDSDKIIASLLTDHLTRDIGPDQLEKGWVVDPADRQ